MSACSAPTSSRQRPLPHHEDLHGESWNPELRAPLAGPASTSRRRLHPRRRTAASCVGADDNIYRLLREHGEPPDRAHVNARRRRWRAPRHRGARRERDGIAAADWIEANRRRVDELSGGRSPTCGCRTPARAATPTSTATTSRSRTGGRDHRRALQWRRLRGRLHRRRPRPRLHGYFNNRRRAHARSPRRAPASGGRR
jgi:hypothetical protein